MATKATHPHTHAQHPYPKPGKVGGRLIRQVIAVLREASLTLPIRSDILIAVSAGSDSIALAHLLAKYGRRVGDKIHFLHVNHRWRAEESDRDEAFVRAFSKELGVKCLVRRLAPPQTDGGLSWENVAREQRKAIFMKEAARRGGIVLTAHQADDLAETVMWRVFTGAAQTHGGGIAVRHGPIVRPLLRIRKRDLQAYLREEGVVWREDHTNFDHRFLRARMRGELLPVIEMIFPRAVEHLVDLALHAQRSEPRPEPGAPNGGEVLIAARGLKVRRPQWEILHRKLANEAGEIHLPEGWKLRREKVKKSSRGSKSERWVLERL